MFPALSDRSVWNITCVNLLWYQKRNGLISILAVCIWPKLWPNGPACQCKSTQTCAKTCWNVSSAAKQRDVEFVWKSKLKLSNLSLFNSSPCKSCRSMQVNWSPCRSTQVHASHAGRSMQVNSSPCRSTQVHASQLKSTQVHASQLKSM